MNETFGTIKLCHFEGFSEVQPSLSAVKEEMKSLNISAVIFARRQLCSGVSFKQFVQEAEFASVSVKTALPRGPSKLS